jgi:hypothetical protein
MKYRPLAFFILVSELLLPLVAYSQPLPELTRVYSAIESRKTDNNSGQSVIRLETEFKSTITIPSITIESCPASVSLSYYQKNTLAHVEGKVEHDGCSVSEGNFDILVSIRNDDGDRETFRHPQTWHIDKENGAEFTEDYAIGENVTLMQVRTSRAKCKCLSDESDREFTP